MHLGGTLRRGGSKGAVDGKLKPPLPCSRMTALPSSTHEKTRPRDEAPRRMEVSLREHSTASPALSWRPRNATAFATVSSPDASGRSLVRATEPSISRSHRSLIVQPAERITKACPRYDGARARGGGRWEGLRIRGSFALISWTAPSARRSQIRLCTHPHAKGEQK